MLAKSLSAGALTLLLTGGALAYIPQQHNIYAGHSNSAQPQQTYAASSCGAAFSLPTWQRANGACTALNEANPAPYGYNDTQGSHALGGGPG
jgi:hypothetical protein